MLGVSGRAMLEALIAGEDDPELLAELARGGCGARSRSCSRRCTGRVTDHHRFLLRLLLDHLEALEDLIDRLSAPDRGGDEPLSPTAAERLGTIPGVDQRAAES